MRKLATFGLAALVALSVDLPARAQSPEDIQAAKILFDNAVELLGQKKIGEACALFERSRKLAVGLGVTLYLADCKENDNRPGSALQLFREAQKMAADRKDAREQVARERADKLEKVAPRILLRVSREVAGAQQQVILDGRKVESAEWAQPIVVDPGDHKVRSMAEDGNVWQSDVTAVLGGTLTVDIPLLRPAHAAQPSGAPVPPTSASAPPEPPKPEKTEASPGSTQRVAGIAVAGVGVVGIGIASVLALNAKSTWNSSNSSNDCNQDTNKCNPAGLRTRDDARATAAVSTVMFVLGAAAVAGGAVLYFTAPRAGKTAGFSVAPAIGAREGGLIARGSFW